MKKMSGKMIAALLAVGCCVGGVVKGGVIASAQEDKRCEELQSALVATKEQPNLNVRAKSAYLMDFNTATPIYALNETARLPIASMCKIMTLILAFDAINEGVMAMDEQITVSERAASMGGSQVFLEAHASYPVKELIKSIVVCSANDSCVALAEKIAGNETAFTDKMNEKAKALGATNTLFSNCTGLPKDPQYSCAKDVAVMLKALLENQEYYEFGKVWLDKFAHPQGRYTEITNTNKLVRFYEGCDGGKTGFTNQAGFCLAATAKRNDMRIISVVIGEENSANRFEDVRSMFDYAFANYVVTPIVQAGVPLEECVRVSAGKDERVQVTPKRSCYAFYKRGEKSHIQIESIYQDVRAPIAQGDKVGELVVYKDNVEIDRVELVAYNAVEKANLFDRIQDVARGWTARK